MPHRRPFHVHFHSHRSKSSSSLPRLSKKKPHLTPVVTLFIPSTCDQTSLECRIYHPLEFLKDEDGKDVNKAAVVAHPYGPLGNGFDDLVVMSLVEVLTEAGWIVATFNFRGVGNSGGRTSWTSNPEAADYSTVTSFLIAYVLFFAALDLSSHAALPWTPQSPTISTCQKVQLLHAGYSYGSMISSHTPPGSILFNKMSKDLVAYAQRTIAEWASDETRRSVALSRQKSPWQELTPSSTNDPTTPSGSDPSAVLELRSPTIITSYLIVSPILPPISTLLSLHLPLFSTSRNRDEWYIKGGETNTMAVYGTSDVFTGIARLRKWAGKCAIKCESGKFQAVEIEDGDHFWTGNEENTVGIFVLKEKVRQWLTLQ